MKKLLTLLAVCSVSLLTACTSCGGGNWNNNNSYYQPYSYSYGSYSYNQPYNYSYDSYSYNQPYTYNADCTTCGSQVYNQPAAVQANDQNASTCGNDQAQTTNQPVTFQDQNAQLVNKPTTTAKTDQDLNKDVNSIIGSGWFSKGFENVSYTVKDGVVTLAGSVNSQDDKNKIEKKVSELNGVRTN